MSYYLILSALLFGIGLLGVIIRRNMLIIMMSIEIMLNAVNIAFIAFSRAWGDMAGQGVAFMVVGVAAAEAALGLAIVIAVLRTRRTIQLDELKMMKN